MKHLAKVLLIGLVAAFVLSACGNTPISVKLDDFSIELDELANTSGKVIYPKEAAKFSKSGINVKTIKLTGNLTYTADIGTSSLTMAFYARLDDPGENGCHDAGLAWICDKGDKDVSISEAKEYKKDVKTPISFGDKNPEILADGVNQGYIWIGVEVSGISGATNLKFDFTDMVAEVTVF